MFAKGQEGGINNKTAETVIGPSVKVEGNFVCQGSIIIEGEVKGAVETNSFLRAGDKSVIVADIKAKNAKISGRVKGNVTVEGYLEITETAKIFGNIEIGQLSIAKGAFITGKCTMVASSKKAEKTEETSKEEEEDEDEK
ncbi:MAG: polymer-forming cytoskeletal protein [bacterium]